MESPIVMTLKKSRDFLRAYNNFLILPHIKADGDALGSAIALKLALENLGKKAQVFNQDEIPYNLSSFFKDEFSSQEPGSGFEALVSVDTADETRLPDIYDRYRDLPLLNIDHHGTNSLYGDINLVYGGLSSTGELMAEVLDELEVELDKEIAQALYIAIVTDTNRFLYTSSTANTLRLAARLQEAGADFEKIHRNIFGEKPLEVLKLSYLALEKSEFIGKNIVFCRLTKEDFKRAGFYETDDVITLLRDIQGVDVAALVYDYQDKHKLSLRSKGHQNVDELASFFGGGGHKKAAGADINLDQLEILIKKLEALSHVG